MFKKLMSNLLIGAILSSFLVFSLPASAVTDIYFTDVGDSENYTAIYYLEDNDVVEGYADGTFKPEAPINRAEFLKILLLSAEVDLTGYGDGGCFPDVDGGQWYTQYVCKAKDLGIIEGNPDGNFYPGRNINFAEAAKIVVNTLELGIVDSADEEWYQKFVLALEELNAIPNTIEHFDNEVTRGEMAEMIWRVKEEATFKVSNTYENLQAGTTTEEGLEELETFTSCNALTTFFEDTAPKGDLGGGYEEEAVMLESADSAAPAEGESTTGSNAKSAEAPGGGSDDYSETNVQVQGVDEADIVKTDGEYIYLVSDNTVRVVKAYPPENMVEMDMVEFGDDYFNPRDLYVDGDRLVVLGTVYGDVYPMPMESAADTRIIDPYWGTTSQINIFDISDASNVKHLRTLSFEGNLNTSRKIDDMVYVVTNRYDYYYYDYDEVRSDELIPLYYDSNSDLVEPMVGCTDIMYRPGVMDREYVLVAGIPIDDVDGAVQKEVILGSSEDVYASRDNLYVAEPRYNYYWYYEDTGDDEKTLIHKFALETDEISYQGKGEVPGTILNQFSMDEYDGHFRITTTLGDVWDSVNLSTNNVYVLDQNMEVVGDIEGIAPGERIYSTRFAGERVYVVTFKKIDPFFVIDLSEPTDPTILGKLKIPGYSDYLHVYDDNHVIGFGKDTVEATEDEAQMRDLDFAWYQGLKLAMFDVTDVSNPVELHKEIIGDRGTDSPLLWNHKALLFDKAKGIMAFPVTLAEIPEEMKTEDMTGDTYGDYVFQGAYVYDVSVEDGFDLRGRITQYDENEVEEMSGYYWYGSQDIERIMYIGDFFYTISRMVVQANEMGSLDEVNDVELEGVEDYDYYYEDVMF